MLTPTTAPPPQITPEAHAELTSRTPASFADIPPILRWEGDAEIELASAQWAYWGNDASAPANGVVGGVQGRLYVTEE
jgi:nucleotide-sensitive chloride channel 1A